MRVQTRKSVKNTRKLTKVAPESKDIKKTPLKGFAKGSVFNKSSIMSSSKSCNDSTDESDGECEEIPFTMLKFKTKRQKKIFTFKCYREEDLNFSAFGDLKPANTRTCDDDCTSDDERVQNAINKLHSSLLEKVEQRKKLKKNVKATIKKSKKLKTVMKNKKKIKSLKKARGV